MSRRPPQLHVESEPPRIWRLRLADGSVQAPLNHLHIQAFVETGAATADSEIAGVDSDTWQRLGDHPLWPDIAPRVSSVRLVVAAAADPGVVPVEVQAPTPKMQAMWQEHHETVKADLTHRASREDLGRFLQGMACVSAVAGLICIGDIIVFTCTLVTAFIFLVALVRFTALVLVWRAMR
jgi:hypothetical protein